MHRVHAMAYAPNLKGRFVNGWFVNILPPLKFPSLAPMLPLFLAQSLLHSLPPSPLSLAPSFPRSFPSSTLPLTLPSFIGAPSLPPSLHPSLPPSLPYLPPSLPPLPPSRSNHSATAPPPIQLNVGLHRVCVWSWRAALSRSYCLAPSDMWHWHNGDIHTLSMTRCYLGNAPPRRIRFWRIVKNPTVETCYKHT